MNLGAIETFRSQIRNMSQEAKVEVPQDADGWALAVVFLGDKVKRFLLVEAPNIGICRGYWWYDQWTMIRIVDGVIVFYGYANEQGAIADCKGNQYKDDYRRLGRREDVRRLNDRHPVYDEINSLLTEENLRRIFHDLPLELRSRKP